MGMGVEWRKGWSEAPPPPPPAPPGRPPPRAPRPPPPPPVQLGVGAPDTRVHKDRPRRLLGAAWLSVLFFTMG